MFSNFVVYSHVYMNQIRDVMEKKVTRNQRGCMKRLMNLDDTKEL